MSSAHFSTEAGGTPTAPGRYVEVAEVEPVEFVPGLEFRPVLGENTLTNFVRFEPHTEAPVHVHEEEQIVIVLEGEFEFSIDGDVRTMRPGDVAVVPPWVPHGARTLDTRCTEVDVFTPPRRSLLQHAAAQVEKKPAADGASGA
ncbi:MAG TPA: cupin domain-containing protein [Mycobacteriales bacterium]|jgi:quercetin dioxygenase-like cupin family protein|nr:cupin domain-containing protein [Mycobacteriales bacterium]